MFDIYTVSIFSYFIFAAQSSWMSGLYDSADTKAELTFYLNNDDDKL